MLVMPGGGCSLYRWQERSPDELSHWIYNTSGLHRDHTPNHDYPANELRMNWNWTWNQAGSNYSTYNQEFLAKILVLSSQSGHLGTNPIVWLCDQEPVKTFQKGPPPKKAKLKKWWTYLSRSRFPAHHIQGKRTEHAVYMSCNNFDAPLGQCSESLAKEAFQCMDVQLDLSMHTTGVLEGWSVSGFWSSNVYTKTSVMA